MVLPRVSVDARLGVGCPQEILSDGVFRREVNNVTSCPCLELAYVQKFYLSCVQGQLSSGTVSKIQSEVCPKQHKRRLPSVCDRCVPA